MLPGIRNVPVLSPFRWLRRGASDFAANPMASLFYGFCYAAMGLAVTLVFENAYEYTSALTSGFLLLGPFLSMGLYELSRQRAQGRRADFASTLTIWRRNAGNIALFALVLTIIFLVWARASLIMFALFYTSGMPNLTGFINQVLSLDNLDFLMVYFGVGMIFALLVFAVSVVSIPMMLDRNQDAITAMLASIAALTRNPGACLLWALIIALATSVGFITFHLGLIPLIPLIGHATWHAYMDLIEAPAVS
ncbi:MAG: DUF2189 domain-containing protein [Rhodocyclaceae bacterium]